MYLHFSCMPSCCVLGKLERSKLSVTSRKTKLYPNHGNQVKTQRDVNETNKRNSVTHSLTQLYYIKWGTVFNDWYTYWRLWLFIVWEERNFHVRYMKFVIRRVKDKLTQYEVFFTDWKGRFCGGLVSLFVWIWCQGLTWLTRLVK